MAEHLIHLLHLKYNLKYQNRIGGMFINNTVVKILKFLAWILLLPMFSAFAYEEIECALLILFAILFIFGFAEIICILHDIRFTLNNNCDSQILSEKILCSVDNIQKLIRNDIKPILQKSVEFENNSQKD